MHELSVANEIIIIVQREIDKRNLKGVAEVNVRLGALSGINPEALAFSFEAATIDSPLAGTKLTIDRIPAEERCRLCGKGFQVDDLIFLCPHCESANIEITQGEELDIEYLVER